MTGWIVRPYDVVIGGVLMRGTYAALAGLLASRLPTNATVVDVGTGPGRMPALLAQRRADLSVIGIDPSADMLSRARRRTDRLDNLDFVQTGAESLPMEDGSVDAVVSSLSSHHWADRPAALAEQSRVLKPAGRFWLLDMKREMGDDLLAMIARSGLTLLDEPSPLGRSRGRTFGFVAAAKPS
jgi:ubiquinone/menaquinone biosynthesis C-methylase UbiE